MLLALDPNAKLPEEWLARAAEIANSPSRTFVAMLGTALLAKATDDRIDPLALKEASGDRAYSARGLCHEVLVPAALELGFHIGATGREPLNNQPFFRYNRLDEMERVKANARPFLDLLIVWLRQLDELDSTAALQALGAFLSVRVQAATGARELRLEEVRLDLNELITGTAAFLVEDPEGGRRGQAFVAAALDLAFDDVRTGRINDPSRRAPGDVHVLRAAQVIVAVEVRQKPVLETDVLRFAAKLSQRGVFLGMVAALAPDQRALAAAALGAAVLEQHGVTMMILTGPAEVLRSAFVWSGRPPAELPLELARRMTERLRELEVSEHGQQSWVDLCRGSGLEVVRGQPPLRLDEP